MDFEKMELFELYYLLLVSNIYNDKDIVTWDINYLYDIINERYKKENNVYLDDKDKLYEWLANKSRYKLLDELLVRLYDRFINVEKVNNYEIDNTDIFFVNNIHEMKRIMEEEEVIAYNGLMIEEYTNKTKIDKWKVIDIVRDILEDIDDTLEWVRLYDKAINDNIIIYLNELNKRDYDKFILDNGIDIDLDNVRNACLFNENGKINILLTYNGDISDISKTIHEVIHYIARCYNGNKKEKTIFRELPSMFYEMYTLNYLKKLGYDEHELEENNIYRLSDTYESINDINILMNYLTILIDKGSITYEDVINEYKEYMEVNDIDSNINNRSDKCINDLIKNPYILFGYYPYIIDNYLASKAILKIEDDKMIMKFMKYITEHIDSVCEEDVFNIILDGKIDLYDEDEKKKVKKK